MTEIKALLKQQFGHSEFRPGQEELINALLSGRDVLGVMPTGAGKSVCYQLPALLLSGFTLVVSPLISLMKDQVAALKESGIACAYINSSLNAEQQREVLSRAREGVYKIIYVAPERLTSRAFTLFAHDAEISMVAVDEAHCVSQWGQDFRPGYLDIAAFVDSLAHRPVVGAFTATATEHVKEDIEKLLKLKNPLRITTGFDRPNLYFEVVRPKSKDAYLSAFISERTGQSGIIYCATRKKVEAVCKRLQDSGITATRYHAGLSDAERRENQETFVYDKARIMVATNAFGMGIDKSNVSFVVHYNMPKNIESYYQEAGRAGRDGAPAHCVLLFSPGDVQTARFLIENSEENEALTPDERALIRKRDMERLEKMSAYCKTTGCLRAFLLSYFGEAAPTQCGSCGNCIGEMETKDITVEAQKILSGVARTEQKYSSGLGLTLIVRMLQGSKEQRVMELGLDKLSTYGIMHDLSRTEIRAYVEQLINYNYLYLTEGDFPVLHLTEKANEVLFHGQAVIMTRRKQSAAETIHAAHDSNAPLSTQADSDLLQALKALRTRLAQEEKVPAYIVFSNAALADMAAKQPTTMETFLQVAGVGEVKAQKYGRTFIAEINSWLEGRA